VNEIAMIDNYPVLLDDFHLDDFWTGDSPPEISQHLSYDMTSYGGYPNLI
jgi:hypothetical protein